MLFHSLLARSLILLYGLALVIPLFAITDSEELQRQPALREQLITYPVYALGESYIIVQLHVKK